MRKLIVLVFFPFILVAQTTVVSEKDSILIGDQIQMTFTTKASNPLAVFSDTIGSLEIISKSEIDSVNTESGLEISQTYRLTAWNSGTFYVPSLVQKNKVIDSIPIVVSSVALPDSLSLSEIELKDIKKPIRSPLTFSELSPYLLILLAIVLLIFFVRRYLKYKSKQESAPKVVQTITPPHQIAIEQLEGLQHQKLWQNGDIKSYYSRLSEIIRTYIENGLNTPAMEIPTHDIIHQLHQKRIETNSLNDLLSRADLAKFAKAKPIQIENEESYQIALQFVHQTKPATTTNDLE